MRIRSLLPLVFAVAVGNVATVATFGTVGAQSLTVTIDGSNLKKPDNVRLIGQEYEIERVTLARDLPVRPGKTTTQTFSIAGGDSGLRGDRGMSSDRGIDGDRELGSDRPPVLAVAVELQLGETVFLASAGDSIHVSFDPQEKKYVIDGGRYPGNYRLLPMLTAIRYPRDLYRADEDNYDQYVRSVDSVSCHALSLIREEREKGSLSSDAADYLGAYIKYRHLAELMTLPSKARRSFLPFTHSILFPAVTLEDFHKDQYAPMMAYIFCARVYVRNQFKFVGETAGAGKVAGAGTTHDINYAIDSLTGGTRDRLLYSLIVPSGYKGNGDKATLTALFGRIRSLRLAPYYADAIDRQYKKDMLEQEPLDAQLLTQPLLRTADGKTVSLRSILDASRNSRVFFLFREDEFDVLVSGNTTVQPMEEKPKVISVYLNDSYQTWQKLRKRHEISADAYYIDGGLKNPLVAYLQISRLPTYVALNASGKIENIDVSLSDQFRYNLTSVSN